MQLSKTHLGILLKNCVNINIFHIYNYIYERCLCLHSFSKECRDVSLKVALNSVQKDVTLSKGSLVSLHAQPRQAAKKNIYIIGKQFLKAHQAYSNIYYNAME